MLTGEWGGITVPESRRLSILDATAARRSSRGGWRADANKNEVAIVGPAVGSRAFINWPQSAARRRSLKMGSAIGYSTIWWAPRGWAKADASSTPTAIQKRADKARALFRSSGPSASASRFRVGDAARISFGGEGTIRTSSSTTSIRPTTRASFAWALPRL